jgi:hypothetical protein
MANSKTYLVETAEGMYRLVQYSSEGAVSPLPSCIRREGR